MTVYLKAFVGDAEIGWWWMVDDVVRGDTVTADEGTVILGVEPLECLKWALVDESGNELTERTASVQGSSPRLSFTLPAP